MSHDLHKEREEQDKIERFVKEMTGVSAAQLRALDVNGEWVRDPQGRNVRVSTIFLWVGRFLGRPDEWETMIFGGKWDGEQVRYTTRDAAVEGHAAWVAKVTRGL